MTSGLPYNMSYILWSTAQNRLYGLGKVPRLSVNREKTRPFVLSDCKQKVDTERHRQTDCSYIVFESMSFYPSAGVKLNRWPSRKVPRSWCFHEPILTYQYWSLRHG